MSGSEYIELVGSVAEEDCCICLEDLRPQDNKPVVQLSCCKHDIHKQCLCVWLIYKNVDVSCPICRAPASSGIIPSLIELQFLMKTLDSMKHGPRHIFMTRGVNDMLRQFYNIENLTVGHSRDDDLLQIAARRQKCDLIQTVLFTIVAIGLFTVGFFYFFYH